MSSIRKRAIWLTPRECETIGRLAEGESFSWIAYSLGCGVPTAKTFAQRAYRKMGVHKSADAVLIHPHHKPTPSRACHVVIRLSSET